MTKGARGEKLVQTCYAAVPILDLNLQPHDCKSDALPLRHHELNGVDISLAIKVH